MSRPRLAHCPKGHSKAENSYVSWRTYKGHLQEVRQCRICRAEQCKARRAPGIALRAARRQQMALLKQEELQKHALKVRHRFEVIHKWLDLPIRPSFARNDNSQFRRNAS